MENIIIDADHVNQHHLEICIGVFEKLRTSEEKILCLEARQRMQEIDVPLIAYFILFKKELPDLQIELRLPYNSLNEENADVEYKLKQYGTYAYLMAGKEVFQVVFGDEVIGFDLGKGDSFETNSFVLSRYFMLLLLVDKMSEGRFSLLFEKSLEELVGYRLEETFDDVAWSASGDELERNYSHHILDKSSPKDPVQCIINLGELAFYRALHRAKVISFYLDPEYRNRKMKRGGIQASSLVGDDAYKYYESVKRVFDDLAGKPLVYQFIFSTLMSSELLPGELNDTVKDSFRVKLFTLWDFTKDLVYGLLELAKNIREHTDSGTGIITARIYRKSTYRALQQTDGNVVLRYINEFHHEHGTELVEDPAFLEMHVLDLGKKGVINTLLEGTHKTAISESVPSHLKESLKQDIGYLESGNILFRDLLVRSQKPMLNQQSKRSIAHLGLLLFSKLIEKNRGLLIASTNGYQKTREIAVAPEEYMQGEIRTVPFGTNYRIVLPVRAGMKYDTHIPHDIPRMSEASAVEIKGLHELFNYEMVDMAELNAFKPAQRKKYLITLKMSSTVIQSREDEGYLWNYFQRNWHLIADRFKDHDQYLLHLDFGSVDINNASHLFRFLGSFHAEYPKVTLILSNILNSIFFELCDINLFYWEHHKNMDFWNRNAAVIVYNYVKDEQNRRFYFSDALWGATKREFQLLNLLIKRTNFNSTMLFGDNVVEEGEQAADNFIRISKNNIAFFNDNVLLPFDLLLKGSNDMTFFEHNTLMLLQNKIKSGKPRE